MVEKQYKCSVCHKAFDNPQKLGGHKTTHKRYKGMSLIAKGIKHSCKNCERDITTLSQRGRKRIYCNRSCMVQYRDRNTLVYDITRGLLKEYRQKNPNCEICGLYERAVHASNKSRASNLSVDHNHKTGKFRGLLCSSCNRNLGWAENNLSAILGYLNK